MAHFAIPLVNFNINTIDIVIVPCQFLPSPIRTYPCASIPRKRMPRRPRILSFPGAVVAFCKSLRLPSATNRYPRHAARRTLVPSPTQVKTADMEVDDSVFAHKGHSLDTVDHKLSPEANVASSSSLSELQARSKSPLSLISCPILEHWNSSALEVSHTLTYELVLFLLTNSTLPVPKPPNPPCPMKNRYMRLMEMKGIPSDTL